MHYLIEDSLSLQRSKIESGDLWSTSPGLAELIAQKGQFANFTMRSPETLIGHEQYSTIWKNVIDELDAVGEAFRLAEKNSPIFDYLWMSQGPQTYFEILMWITKAATLSALREAVGNGLLQVIGCPRLKPTVRLSASVGRHDHVYAALAHELGGSLPLTVVDAPDATAFERSLNHVPLFDKVFNIVNRSTSALSFQLWNKSRFCQTFGSRGKIVILSANDLIEESFIELIKSGWRVCKWPKIANQQLRSDAGDLNALNGLEGHIKASWHRICNGYVAEDLSNIAWSMMWGRLSECLLRHGSALDQARLSAGEVSKLSTRGEKIVVLSNGLYGPEQRLLDAALREVNIPVVCLDHGSGMGVGFRHDFVASFWASFSDNYFTYNDATQALFDSAKSRTNQTFTTAGSPKIIRRARLRAIQRVAGRRYLKLSRSDHCLMYVTNISINNVPRGYGTASDDTYSEFQKSLLQCLSQFDGRVIIKPYPAFRYIDPDLVWTMQHARNTTIAPFGEFRHIRWSADILITDICSSTLSWAMATDIPLVYVNNASNPLSERAMAELEASVYFVNAERAGWQDSLESILGKSSDEIKQGWTEMSSSRAKFSDHFVLGPEFNAPRVISSSLNGVLQRPLIES